jgi:hypothetical protein
MQDKTSIKLTEQDADLLEQAASMLEGLENDERNRGNCSTAEGAGCSAHAVRRLASALLAHEREIGQCLHQIQEPAPVQAAPAAVAVPDGYAVVPVAVKDVLELIEKYGEASSASSDDMTMESIKAKVDLFAEIESKLSALLAGVAAPAAQAVGEVIFTNRKKPDVEWYVESLTRGMKLYAAPQAQADARDAERYRYLRDEHIGDDPESISLKPARMPGLDASIDAAIAAAKGE